MALRRRRRGENAPSPLRARPPLIARARAAPLPLLTAGGSSPQGRAGPAVHRGAASPGGRVVVLVWFFVCFVFPRPLQKSGCFVSWLQRVFKAARGSRPVVAPSSPTAPWVPPRKGKNKSTREKSQSATGRGRQPPRLSGQARGRPCLGGVFCYAAGCVFMLRLSRHSTGGGGAQRHQNIAFSPLLFGCSSPLPSAADMHTNLRPCAPSGLTGTSQDLGGNTADLSLAPALYFRHLHKHICCLPRRLPCTSLLSHTIPPQKLDTDAPFLLFLFILVSSKCVTNLVFSKGARKHLTGKSPRAPLIPFSEMREAVLSSAAPQDAFHSSLFLWTGKLNYFHGSKLP